MNPLLLLYPKANHGAESSFSSHSPSASPPRGPLFARLLLLRLAIALGFPAISALLLAGCCTSKECLLQHVAKDWCMTIRASQVIPVYPLTEDVLPGDVFLASRRISEEQKDYEQHGFLPLAQLIVRLHPEGIEDFYLSSHGTKGATNPPYFWRFDGPNLETNQLRLMPRAAFPAYNFSARRGAGLNVAVPIQGIPVAMNLVGSSSVDGTVLLKDAYSYGFDQANLQNTLLDWATNNTELLKGLAPADGNINYLRMISRIYLVGAVNVSVTSASSFAGSLSGGADKPVNLPNLSGTNTIADYTNSLAALSSSLSTALNAPGGTLKIASASSRSVSLDETFPRPLVVGYLGFDFQILTNGKLALPHSTLHRLTGSVMPVAGQLVRTYNADVNSSLLRTWLKADPDHRKQLRAWLDEHNLKDVSITHILDTAAYTGVRQEIIDAFQIK